jgi:hypothetical protein
MQQYKPYSAVNVPAKPLARDTDYSLLDSRLQQLATLIERQALRIRQLELKLAEAHELTNKLRR